MNLVDEQLTIVGALDGAGIAYAVGGGIAVTYCSEAEMRRGELTPAIVAARLQALRRIVPEPELVPGPEREVRDTDMSPEAVRRRLDELRALDDLAMWLASASVAR